jgi:hypothetical protein
MSEPPKSPVTATASTPVARASSDACNTVRPARRSVKVGILDLIAKGPVNTPYTRVMYPNFASIMPQVIGVWAEQLGHRVSYSTYMGFEDLESELFPDVDILFVSAFTQAAYLAYSVSASARRRGVVTVLGGPHARAYPGDARRYFDYVVGLADRSLIQDLLADFSPQPSEGVLLSADRQPRTMPTVQERWKFIRHNLAKSPIGGSVPMLGSFGCPYKCSFCIDSQFDYEPLPYDALREDLTFVARAMRRPLVAWHDPNFAVRFNDYMQVIEQAAAPGSIRFVAECSLSLLSEKHLGLLRRNGCIALIVGIESWFDFNDKAKQARRVGMDKVQSVAEHVNLITEYIPYTQTNFVWGLDEDAGSAPFELNKRFVDQAPAAFPSHSLFTAYGESAPLGSRLQREGRMLDVPFHFQDTASIHNVKLNHYPAHEFYGHLSDVVQQSYSPRATLRRFRRNTHGLGSITRWIGAVRSIASKPRARRYRRLQELFSTDKGFRAFASGEGGAPRLVRDEVRAELGVFYEHLPADVLRYLEG